MATHGTTCPYCEKYSSVRKDGKLYVHKGHRHALVSPKFLDCAASKLTWGQAKELRDRVNSGQHVISAKVDMGLM